MTTEILGQIFDDASTRQLAKLVTSLRASLEARDRTITTLTSQVQHLQRQLATARPRALSTDHTRIEQLPAQSLPPETPPVVAPPKLAPRKDADGFKICAVPWCNKPYYARDLCITHYARYARHGDPLLRKQSGGPYQPGRVMREVGPGNYDEVVPSTEAPHA